eukprot:TRINITY_DN5243_c0_g1_i2.p1 TRINITY_DN5243_c0_g1~~TRINITY_DN5243_c0_g1_i2.p1  ORF type:complete len:299 (+),score=37.26 TRINITY_DN5243_c0_g1_i2:202-1098(+)
MAISMFYSTHVPAYPRPIYSVTLNANQKHQRLTEAQPARKRRKRVYLVDVQPLCYTGSKRRPSAFVYWIKLLYQCVAKDDPIIAVLDGERGTEYRMKILPSYKSNRKKFDLFLHCSRWTSSRVDDVQFRDALPWIEAFFHETDVPVVKIDDAEADDVVATLAFQLKEKGFNGVIASPDKDFRQLICDYTKLVIPVPELGRWSFYTLNHYVAQHGYDPSIDLSLRCMLGDENDCIPGLPQVIPAFGRKTAMKLLKKHGSLENILKAAAVRTIGKPYVQDAFTKHANLLLKNIQLLELRR